VSIFGTPDQHKEEAIKVLMEVELWRLGISKNPSERLLQQQIFGLGIYAFICQIFKFSSWYPEQQFFNGCFSGIIPNLYMKMVVSPNIHLKPGFFGVPGLMISHQVTETITTFAQVQAECRTYLQAM